MPLVFARSILGFVVVADTGVTWADPDIANASYDSVSFSVASQAVLPYQFYIKSDGTKLFLSGTSSDTIYQYSMSTAWDISTASYTQNFSVSTQDSDPEGVFFKPDGTKMYIVGASQAVNEYDVGTTSATTLTWPSSIEWHLGVTPFAPANGQTDLFTISTDDGGTTYIGLHTADNLS